MKREVFESRVGHLHLGGTWHAVWETSVDHHRNVNREVLRASVSRRRVRIINLSASVDNVVGGYLWRADLKIHGDRFLSGTYKAAEANMLYNGTLYAVLHASGQFMEGRWVGANFDDDLATGRFILARTAPTADDRFTDLCAERPRARGRTTQTTLDIEED